VPNRIQREIIGLTQLAREMGISRSGLFRKVKTLADKSISRFIMA
jgi:hypothetical protein